MPNAREGGEHERRDYFPSRKGDLRASPEKIFEFCAPQCAFLMGL